MATPHAVVVPHPSSGNINPALQLAKLLHHHGIYITFVNTVHNHRVMVTTEGATAVRGHEGFRFEVIPDGLVEADRDAEDYDLRLSTATSQCSTQPLKELLLRLNATPGVPPVTCVLPTSLMSFALDVARELGVPSMVLWACSAASLMTHMRLRELKERGYVPLKELLDERTPECDGHRLDPRHAADQPRRHLQLRPHDRPGQLRPPFQHRGGQRLHQGRRTHPQHLRRPRSRRPRRPPRRVPAHLHRRSPRLPPQPPPKDKGRLRLRLRQRPEPVEAGQPVPRVAGHATTGLHRVRQLRQPHGPLHRPARRVRVGPPGQRPPVSLVH
ncbi:UDP-glycosyltransferase 85A4-like isoform X2 [Triticum dicoccoides]|uniref:UDP-glycosyltransferase 85A4-like isoform X2 n=1 Tax=Triticum dicoccoides TaxID=85692 RepID=UPI001890425C|nr:UDP-glycosyltransferase 85A4-like isoform X2 [Triticum dicoccoides]